MKQGNKEHYKFSEYGYPERWASYHYQLREIFLINPKEVLYVGVGDNVVSEYIKKHSSISCKTFDINPELKPDIIGNVLEMPFHKESFDVVSCFEVLEHIPFDKFEEALREISRVSRGGVILSLPHFGPMIRFSFKFPFLPELRFLMKIPYPKKHDLSGEHYWEIGKRGYEIGRAHV